VVVSKGSTEKPDVCANADPLAISIFAVRRKGRSTTIIRERIAGIFLLQDTSTNRQNRLMDIVDYLRNSEQPIYDFNTPWSMAIVVFGFLSAWLITNVLEHLGVTRHVWHLPLFFAALAVFFGSLIGLSFAP